jgi:hypothetical protein
LINCNWKIQASKEIHVWLDLIDIDSSNHVSLGSFYINNYLKNRCRQTILIYK